MIRRIEAYNYRCLRSVDQSINPFEILVGSNGSGKSTFLDVIAFLGDMVDRGLEAAVEQRTANFHDLVWGREGDCFQLAIAALIPEDKRPLLNRHEIIRYQCAIRLDVLTEKIEIAKERVTVCAKEQTEWGHTTIDRSDTVTFIAESSPGRYERQQPHRNYSVLNSIPVDSEFSATVWLREFLRRGIRPVALSAEELRKPSPPAASEASELHGGYLPRLAAQLRSANQDQFNLWLAHIRSVIPDIKNIRTVLREDDKHRYLVVDYENGVSVPSWMISDGTLRLLALTLLAYAPGQDEVYLIEEPENGVHPTALQAIYESLSSVYEGQVLLASHSPVLLSMAKPQELLCFNKTPEGTQIIRGSEHQALRDWQGEVSLGMLAASGILG